MQPVAVVIEWENADSYPSDDAIANVERLTDQIARGSHRWNSHVPIRVVYDPDKSSASGARHLCERLQARHPDALDVAPVEQRGGGYTGQKIAGVHAADAETYVFADCDCVYDEDWFETILAPVLDGKADYAFGRNIMDTSTIWGLAAAVFWFYPLEADVPNGPPEPYFSNLVLSRRAYAAYPFFGDPGHREAAAMWSSTIQRQNPHGARLLTKAYHPPPGFNMPDLMAHARAYGRIDDALAAARGYSRLSRIGMSLGRIFRRLARVPARTARVARLEHARSGQVAAMVGISVAYILATGVSRLAWACSATHKRPDQDPRAAELAVAQN